MVVGDAFHTLELCQGGRLLGLRKAVNSRLIHSVAVKVFGITHQCVCKDL